MVISCPLCNNQNTSLLFIKKDIPYYSCTSCGFIFSSTTSNANLDNKITDFETSYLQYFDEKKSDKKNHAKMLDWVNQLHPGNHKTLLDIGCGSGKWVNYLTGQGLTATGIEPSFSLYDHFLNGNPAFFYGTIDEFATANTGNAFDVITTFDVLEHIKDPVSFMKTITRLMHPGSHLLMSMPDVRSCHRKITGKR
ncbi:MAG: class I SAM-dependent methyltransferase [Bacteroidota bacterium]|nr:class I SAM-dependent methyltransferase [Bacteroidota bacterium]